MRRASGTLGLVVVLAVVLLSPSDAGGIQIGPAPMPPPTPGWDTKANHPNDPNYFRPPYPIAFVKSPLAAETVVSGPICRDLVPAHYPDAGSVTCGETPLASCTDGMVGNVFHDREILQSTRHGVEDDYHTGADVVTATNPGVGNELWIYLPLHGLVKKLFPRAIHYQNGKIDFPTSVGSVVEPSVSEDGTKIYFSYFQDATETESALQDSFGERIPLSGADIYAIDIAPLLDSPLWDPDNLQVTRLTTRQYVTPTPSVPDPRTQLPADRDKEAMNPTRAAATTNAFTNFGTVYLHPTEVRTRTGLHLAYVSNKRRLANSNVHMARSNYNLNLHLARLNPDGTLGPDDNQFQYYTTTSAQSPTPLREGLAFSYQATTDDARYWHIQKLDSEGRWGPLIGYGHGDKLFHLGSFCVADEGGLKKDYFVGLKYYNMNSESFGSIFKQDLATLGKNTYDNLLPTNAKVPRQVGSTELTLGGDILSLDNPSPFDDVTEKHYGKFTTPRCGGVNELYFAYTQTSANNRLNDRDCNTAIYRSHIGYRDNLLPWTPGRPVGAQNGHYTVIKRTADDFNLLWPVPIMGWDRRSDGDVTQRYTESSATKPTAHITPGEPFALVGTSALWNTDRRPPECYIKQGPGTFYFHPFGSQGIVGWNNQNDQITNNQDLWTQVYAGGFCSMPPPSSILGIAINITSNKTDMNDNIGYVTGFGQPKEASRLLGVYDVRNQDPENPNDQSFFALIPAHVPFEFQALDSTYGMKLADVRSWHSLRVRETRTDCGGCHQHQDGAAAVPFAGTYAAGRPPLDLVRSTPSVGYGPACNVVTDAPDNLATEGYPEWGEIWSGMQTYCGSCHAGNGNTGSAALSWNSAADGQAVYNAIVLRQFASAQRGALGSQLFWAARGLRTDGRPNASSQFTADYDCSTCPNGDCNHSACTDKIQWGFYYSSAHDADPGGKLDCGNNDQAYASWVFKLGKWIDNHLPKGNTYAADWYHPTADSALDANNCATSSLRVGWWDDTGQVASVKVSLNDQPTPIYSAVSRPNGTQAGIALPPVSNNDWITVEVRDAADNRQIYRKRIDQLVEECDLPPLPQQQQLDP